MDRYGNYDDFRGRASVDLNVNARVASERVADLRRLSKVLKEKFPRRDALFIRLDITNITAADMHEVCELFKSRDRFFALKEVYDLPMVPWYSLPMFSSVFTDMNMFDMAYGRMARQALETQRIGGPLFADGDWVVRGARSWARTRSYIVDWRVSTSLRISLA